MHVCWQSRTRDAAVGVAVAHAWGLALLGGLDDVVATLGRSCMPGSTFAAVVSTIASTTDHVSSTLPRLQSKVEVLLLGRTTRQRPREADTARHAV